MSEEDKSKKTKKEKNAPRLGKVTFLGEFKLKEYIYKRFLKEIEDYKLNN